MDEDDFVVSALNCSSLIDTDAGAEKKVNKLIRLLEEFRKENEPVNDVIVLTETRINEYARLVGGGTSSHILFSSSKGSYYGTGFLVRFEWKDSIRRFKSVSDRLSFIDICVRGYYLRIIAAYLPSNSDVDTARRSAYQDILNYQISKLIRNAGTPYIIVGDFNAIIGAFNKYDTKYIGEETVLNNFSEKQKVRNFPGQQCVNFCKLKKLYVVNRFTEIPSKDRFTFERRKDGSDRKEIDYILSPVKPAEGSFSITHNIFKLKERDLEEDRNKFSTDHRLIRYTFKLSMYSGIAATPAKMDYFMQVSFVVEWATVLGRGIICLLFKDVASERARDVLERWSMELDGVNVGTCNYSFYNKNCDVGDIVVLSQTNKEANKIFEDINKELNIQPSYISNYKTDLSGGKRVKFLQLDLEGQITISRVQDHYSNETIERTRQKWDSLLNYDYPTLTLVKDMLAAENPTFKSPLLKRLIFVKDRWMELLSSEELWGSTFELYDLALNRNERIIELLPILNFLETNVNKTQHVLKLQYTEYNDMKNMMTRLRICYRNNVNDFRIERCNNNIFLFIEKLGDVKSAIKTLKKYPGSLHRIVYAYKKNYNNVASEYDIPEVTLVREDIIPVIDGIVLQLQNMPKSCEHYCNLFLEAFKENESILIADGYSLEDRGENFVKLVQTPLTRKLILVPMKPFELAQLAHTESGLLREVVGTYENKTCEELYNMLGIRDFRYAYYGAKWDIAKNSTAREILKKFPVDSIWMRDITWIGEKWHEVAEKEEAWNKLLDLYLKVKIKPLDQTDDYYGVEKAERQNLTD